MSATCAAVYADRTFNYTAACERPNGHAGKHQQWTPERRTSWDDGIFGAASSFTPEKDGNFWGGPVYECAKCGAKESWHWSLTPTREDYCFYCNFWLKLLQNEDHEDFLVISGKHYQIGPAGREGPVGFAGGKFVIVTDDGRRIETCNLWTQGVIPPHWRADFPDSAKFETGPLR